MLRIYKYLLSPMLHFLAGPGTGCRFEPSCSHYAAEAVRIHGWMKGILLGLRRLSRCQPWGGWGFDPVPESAIRQKGKAKWIVER